MEESKVTLIKMGDDPQGFQHKTVALVAIANNIAALVKRLDAIQSLLEDGMKEKTGGEMLDVTEWCPQCGTDLPDDLKCPGCGEQWAVAVVTPKGA